MSRQVLCIGIIVALSACRALPIVECTVLCEAGTRCAASLTCGTDGYCHSDNNLQHCAILDGAGAASDGGGDGPAARRAFVSANAYRPGIDFSSVATADQRCGEEATKAGLSGNYVALLSSKGESAAGRFSVGAAWFRLDGALWIENRNELANQLPHVPLDLDPTGVTHMGYDDALAWTGSSRGPNVVSLDDNRDNCSDWTSATGTAISGRADLTGKEFFNWTSQWGCEKTTVRIYCLEN